MKTRIQKWGNSLALRIPKLFANEIGLEQDSSVEMSLEDGRLVIVTAPQSRLTLRRLLAKVTKDNRHAEFESEVILADQIKNLNWRVRDAEWICTLPHRVVVEVLQKLGTLLS